MLLSDPNICKIKVSSVLNKSADFAGKNMLDGDLNTCWNSAAGADQFIVIDFTRHVIPNMLSLIFQGGFVGQSA